MAKRKTNAVKWLRCPECGTPVIEDELTDGICWKCWEATVDEFADPDDIDMDNYESESDWNNLDEWED